MKKKIFILILLVLVVGAGVLPAAYRWWNERAYWHAEPAKVESRVIDQAFVDEHFSDLVKLFQSGRLGPHLNARGKFAGFELSSFGPDSAFLQQGFQNGDVIVRVNDVLMDAPDALLKAIQKVKGTPIVDFTVHRKGEWLRLHYTFPQPLTFPQK